MGEARKLTMAMLGVAAAAVLAACGGGGDDATTGAAGGESAAVSGKFVTLAEEPAGDFQIMGEAELERANGGTVVSLNVSGLQPKTRYIAHLHTGGCDQADPGGPHFQFEKGGSEEPPNEIHLNFTSDAAGDGKATASSKREVPVGEAGSVAIHRDGPDEMTSFGAAEPEAETVFAHRGTDHSKEGAGHGSAPEPEHAHSDKIACAELEGAAPSGGDSQAGGGDVPMIIVRDGEPVGGVQELEFDAGEEIRFRVSSDEAEEIHVHGYDIAKDVPAGGTIEFAFPAELEGIYEAELEKQGVQIAELQINP